MIEQKESDQKEIESTGNGRATIHLTTFSIQGSDVILIVMAIYHLVRFSLHRPLMDELDRNLGWFIVSMAAEVVMRAAIYLLKGWYDNKFLIMFVTFLRRVCQASAFAAGAVLLWQGVTWLYHWFTVI